MLIYDQVDYPHHNNNAPPPPNTRPVSAPYSSTPDQTLQCLDYLSCKPSFRVYTKAETNCSLTIRDGQVILARVDPSDPFQQWVKDERYSTMVKDEEGFPSFALLNKATGQAMKHSVDATHPDDNDVLRRSPGTPVFTVPECCLGLTYHGKAADTWAPGATLYCMVLGNYPLPGDNLHDTYDKIVSNELFLPDNMNPLLKNLVEGLLCKDPDQRMSLANVAEHPWVVVEEGPIPPYLCWCERNRIQRGMMP